MYFSIEKYKYSAIQRILLFIMVTLLLQPTHAMAIGSSSDGETCFWITMALFSPMVMMFCTRRKQAGIVFGLFLLLLITASMAYEIKKDTSAQNEECKFDLDKEDVKAVIAGRYDLVSEKFDHAACLTVDAPDSRIRALHDHYMMTYSKKEKDLIQMTQFVSHLWKYSKDLKGACSVYTFFKELKEEDPKLYSILSGIYVKNKENDTSFKVDDVDVMLYISSSKVEDTLNDVNNYLKSTTYRRFSFRRLLASVSVALFTTLGFVIFLPNLYRRNTVLVIGAVAVLSIVVFVF